MSNRLPFILSVLILCPFLLLPTAAMAQGTDASVVGTVVDEGDGKPLPGATVQVENTATGFTAGTTTDRTGEFSVGSLPLGPYSVAVSFVGYGTERRTGFQLTQGDEVQLEIALSEATQELEEVVVEGIEFRNRTKRLDASTHITADQVETLPAQNRDFTDLTKLSPRTGGGSNIAGYDNRTNAITIDGVNAKESNFGNIGDSPYVLSMEALQEFEVVTNSYSVTEGRGTSGSVKAVTKSGTNEFEGTVFGNFWDARLAADTDLQGRSFQQDTKSQRGFTVGGPILEDELHFFAAYDGERNSQTYSIWAQSTEPGVMQNGIEQRASEEAVNQILEIGREKYGVDLNQKQTGFFQRTVQLDTYLARLDWQINDAHTLTARYISNDFEKPNMDNSHISRHGVHDQSYNLVSEGRNGLLSLRSQLSPNLRNDLKLGYFWNRRANVSTNGRVPNTWVEFTSEVNGRQEQARISIRGYEWVPEDQRSETFSLVNNTYYSTDQIDFTFGTENTLVKSSGLWTHGQQGRFTFNSIEALENMNPSRFTRRVATEGRQLTDPVQTRHLELSAYAQAEMDIAPRLEGLFGLRYDVTHFLTSPKYNPVLEEELGLRNDTTPIDWDNIQPRLDLTWDITGDGRNILQGGAGFFQGQTMTRPYAQSVVFDGLRFYEVKATGDDVPTPDYDAYEEDFTNIPGQELAPPEDERRQVVRMVDPNFEMPYAFRANLSYHRYITDWWRVGANLYYNRITDLPFVTNPNLDTDRGFRLNGEGGRRVYAPKSALREDPRDGFNPDASRISDRFAEVSMYTSGYEQTAQQLVLESDVQLPNNGRVRLSYTRNRSLGAAIYHNEVDDRYIGRQYDDFDFLNNGHSQDDFLNKLLFVFTSPEVSGFQASGFVNLLQGDRYTATIDGRTNISGLPGEHDYPAFVFDPNDSNTPDQIAEDMEHVLENSSEHFREYLQRNMGQYATPNGGVSPWEPEVDLRLVKRFDLPLGSYGEQLVVDADVFNVLNVLNSDWGGQQNVVDTRLLQVTGFNADENRYEYQVNRDAGQRRYEGPGFRMRFGLKYRF
jgi:hypothetical protein